MVRGETYINMVKTSQISIIMSDLFKRSSSANIVTRTIAAKKTASTRSQIPNFFWNWKEKKSSE